LNPSASARAPRQFVKWTVYALLFLDFILYLWQDAESAHYTLGAAPLLLDYARAYVTSIDLAAWFMLILLLELETYVLVGRAWTGATRWTVQGIRLACCVVILHTSYANLTALNEFRAPRALAAGDACGYVDEGWSFLSNRDYIDLDRQNCATLGQGTEYFAIGDDFVLTDRAGLREGLVLAWTDLAESVAWLLIVLATELAVRMMRRAGANTGAMRLLEHVKMALYVLILVIALYWGSKLQFLYLWDELIWIFGFLLIDRNIHDWRAGPRVDRLNPALNAPA